ncbi:protein FAM162A-like [Paramacrobiotus metropolitanus]|uniref:protein FAM162A-like n=1 Tax=Paramacrobiotus metropolitanus TaxID=2943436 RepID=UPI0024456984|nr:protein FAM162A-like [Paramacrobiotus metropolitanus]
MLPSRIIGSLLFKMRSETLFSKRFFTDDISSKGLSNFQKRVLVWTKRYPSVDQIPERISSSTMSKAYDKFRWRIAVIGMLLSVVASFGYAIAGKRAAARGDTIGRRYMEWHEELQPGSTKPIA